MDTDFRLVALDLDGTMLEKGREIAPEVIRALHALAEAGVRSTTATGRPRTFQLELLARHGMGTAGTLPHAIMADERELFFLGPDGQYHPHAAWNEAIRRRWNELHADAMAWLGRAETEAHRRGWPARTHISDAEAYARGLPSLLCEHPDQADAIRGWVAGELAAARAPLAANRNGRLVQIIDAAAGKGKTLAELARRWEIRPDQVLAMGDSSNDLSMLDGQLGFRCATTANADEPIKDTVRSAGGYVAGERMGAGVVEALYALIGATFSRHAETSLAQGSRRRHSRARTSGAQEPWAEPAGGPVAGLGTLGQRAMKGGGKRDFAR